jgi:hypothetical protein
MSADNATPTDADKEAAKRHAFERAVATECLFQGKVSADRDLAIRCFIPMDASEAVYNSVLDKLYKVFERQKAKAEIIALEKHLEVHQRTADDVAKQKDLVTVKAQEKYNKGNKRIPYEPSEKEKNDLAGLEDTQKRGREEIEKARKLIAERKALVENLGEGAEELKAK